MGLTSLTKMMKNSSSFSLESFIDFTARLWSNANMSSTKSTTGFAINYDGPILKDHTINARDLAPALLAISDLCQEANRALGGEDSNVEVRVRATGEGSFDVLLDAVQLVSPLTPLLVEAGKPSARDMFELVTWLVEFFKRKRGRPITEEKMIASKEGGIHYELSFGGDNNTVIINQAQKDIIHNYPARKGQHRLLSPLEVPGITAFSMRDMEEEQQQTKIRVTETEFEEGYFDVVPSEVGLADELVPPQEIPALLILQSAVFKRGRAWEFLYGTEKIFARILDEKFNEEVFEGTKRFGRGDRFRVMLRITQNQLADGNIRNSHEILEVLGSLLGPKPQKLPLG